MSKNNCVNDGTRTLFESMFSPELGTVIKRWFAGSANPGVLIGGLALSHWVKPRMTQDIDVILLSDSEIPASVPGFKKARAHCFRDVETHIEVEIVTPEFVNTSEKLFSQVIATCVVSDEIKIASPSGIVALKLGRFSLQDQADIVQLINHFEINVTGFDLDDIRRDRFLKIMAEAKDDPGSNSEMEPEIDDED